MKDGFFSPANSSANCIQTTSAFRMWWLKRLKGYRLVLVKRAPELNAFGQIRYRVFWLLEPPAATSKPAGH